MTRSTGSSKDKLYFLLFIILFLLVSVNAQAATTVTVDSSDQVTVTQPVGYAQTAVAPVIITREAMAGDFEGRIVRIDYAQYQMVVQDVDGRSKDVTVKPELINYYRIGDYVLIRPTTDLTVITLQENPREFEGEIIRVDIPDNQLVVLDTNGRERKVDLKQGMIGTYKVDDYVRIHLMADLKEAKTIETIRDVRSLEGNIVNVEIPASRIVIRGNDGKDNTVLIRQGQIHNYRVGDYVRIYLLKDNEQVQVIRVIR